MKRLNKILSDAYYRQCLLDIKKAESDRIFCRHTLEHFLDVARITYILCLEHHLCVDKEVVYAIGLLHDIGRARQYTIGQEHHIASVEIAGEILPKCDFDKAEIDTILNAIKSHRADNSSDMLSQFVYKADKLSRNCFDCNARGQCNWDKERMNNGVQL